MRWLVLPGIFVALGPPVGAVALLTGPVLLGLVGPGALAGVLMILPIAILFSYLLGGVQALLVGIVAALTVRDGVRVRAVPILLAATAIGAGLHVAGARIGEFEQGAPPTLAVFVGLHLAAALAGLGVCRWMERAARTRP